MVDFHNIDAFFNGEKPLENQTGSRLTKREKLLRFLKLAMPSAAAVLVAAILLYPSLKRHDIVAELDVTLPKKGELEKLHIEQTEFTMTDKNNKVSRFIADRIDETEPGSKLMKIINPQGEIPLGTDGELAHINSDIGYFNQAANTVRAEENVKAVYDDGTTILTSLANYDFGQSYGQGDKDVYAYGPWGKLWTEGFEYYQTEALLVLTGKSKIISGNRTLWADESVRYWRENHKMQAQGNVVVLENSNVLYADKMIAYFTDEKASEIEKVEAFGHVRVETEKGRATGDYGIYRPQKAEIELEGNVIVKQDGNVIYGRKAITNLNTSVSKIISDKNNKNRVSGIIKGSTLKRKK